MEHTTLFLYVLWGIIGLDKLMDYRLYERKTANFKNYIFSQLFYEIGMRQ